MHWLRCLERVLVGFLFFCVVCTNDETGLLLFFFLRFLLGLGLVWSGRIGLVRYSLSVWLAGWWLFWTF